MRIERLDLTRYGRFTGHAVEFGDAPRGGAPDLHVVYGPNEAGKSTLFSAWLDLLFGGEGKEGGGARYSFQHPLPTMEVGGRVTVGGATHDLVRGFGRDGGLRGADGTPAGTAADTLAGGLGALGRRDYATMFSLDAGVLEEGGQAVLSSEGRLGELLFSSTAGLSGLSDVLAEVRKEADGLYRKGSKRTAANPTELRQLENEIERLDGLIREADMDVAGHEALVEARDRALAAFEAAESEHAAARTSLARAERRLRALDADDARRAALAELDELGDLPPTPPDGSGRLAGLTAESARLDAEASGLARRRAALDARREGLVADPDALAAAPLLDALEGAGDDGSDANGAGADKGLLVARARTADADLPRRRAELAGMDEALARRVTELGAGEDGDVPAPSLEHAAALEALATERAGLIERLAAASRALDEAADAHAAAEDALRAFGDGEDAPTAETIAALKGLARRTLAGAPHSELTRAREALARATARLAPLLARAGASEPADLARLDPPGPATLAAWRERAREVELAAREKAARRDDLDLERDRLTARTAALDVPGAAEVATARAARESAWRAHRLALEGGNARATADAFERALADDDAVAQRRLDASERAAERRAAEVRIAEIDAELRRLSGEGAQDATVLEGEVEAAAGPLVAAGVVSAPTLPALEDHAAHHARAVEAVDGLSALEGDLALAREAEDRAVSALADALVTLGLDAGGTSAELAERAEAWCGTQTDRLAATERAREAFARATDALRRREREVDDLARDDSAWRERWERTAVAAGLSDLPKEGEPDVGGAVERLRTLRDHAAQRRERDELAARIHAMEVDRETLLEHLAAMEAVLSPGQEGQAPPDGVPWPVRLAALRERIADAQVAEREARRLDDEARDLADEQRGLDDARTAHERERAALGLALDADGIDAMRAALDRMGARDAAKARHDAARDAIRREGVDEGEIAAVGRDELGEEVRRLREVEPELYAAAGAARDTLTLARRALDEVGGDGRAARLVADRETCLTGMAEVARRAVALQLGVRAAEEALHAYRARHRSAMLERASDAFAAMSCGHFAGLGTALDGRGDEVLYAVRPDGRRVDVPGRRDGRARDGNGLSTGTRHQLYLALRVAGYHEYAAQRPPPPFLCDDVLETFDDDRASATLRLFEDMAREGQVVLLTHHAHLVDLARRTVSGVRVHDLAPDMAAAPALRIAAE